MAGQLLAESIPLPHLSNQSLVANRTAICGGASHCRLLGLDWVSCRRWIGLKRLALVGDPANRDWVDAVRTFAAAVMVTRRGNAVLCSGTPHSDGCHKVGGQLATSYDRLSADLLVHLAIDARGHAGDPEIGRVPVVVFKWSLVRNFGLATDTNDGYRERRNVDWDYFDTMRSARDTQPDLGSRLRSQHGHLYHLGCNYFCRFLCGLTADGDSDGSSSVRKMGSMVGGPLVSPLPVPLDSAGLVLRKR